MNKQINLPTDNANIHKHRVQNVDNLNYHAHINTFPNYYLQSNKKGGKKF